MIKNKTDTNELISVVNGNETIGTFFHTVFIWRLVLAALKLVKWLLDFLLNYE